VSSESSGWFVDYDHGGKVLGVASPDRAHDLDFIAVLNDEPTAYLISACIEMRDALRTLCDNGHELDCASLIYARGQCDYGIDQAIAALKKSTPKQP